jgi:glycosyltransferase involved in cell wall biosynthesis
MKRTVLMSAYLVYSVCLMGGPPPVEFVVLVTSYNNEVYVDRNLDSIFCQRSSHPFQTIYVNDCSTDSTRARVEAYANRYDLDTSQLLIVNNTSQRGSGLANIYETVHNLIEDHKVVVCVDGDDFLSFSGVLERLEKEYSNKDVWMTYGRFVVIPAGEFWSACWNYPEEVIKKCSFRKHPNVPSHLKTFRAKLFKKIKRSDLVDEKGNFYTKAWDMAMMFPMLEMCSPKGIHGVNHSRFIEDTVLYMYNFANPLGDAQSTHGREEQMGLDRMIRSKKPYEPLGSLFIEN